jgi:hypothetical protein
MELKNFIIKYTGKIQPYKIKIFAHNFHPPKAASISRAMQKQLRSWYGAATIWLRKKN